MVQSTDTYNTHKHPTKQQQIKKSKQNIQNYNLIET